MLVFPFSRSGRSFGFRSLGEPRGGPFAFDNVEYCLLYVLIFREKHKAGTVAALFGHCDSLQQNKLVRYLYHYAGSVAGLGVGAFGTSVDHVLKHLQSFFNKLMRFYALDIDEQSYAAGVVLVAAVI